MKGEKRNEYTRSSERCNTERRIYQKKVFLKQHREVVEIKAFLKALKEMFEIKESTPPFVISGLMGCAVSAILILIRLIQFYFVN